MEMSTLKIHDAADIPSVNPLHTPQQHSIGKQLLDAGKLSPEDAERVLRFQKDNGLRFGEAALQLGLVTEQDIRQVLARQFDYPYLPSRNGEFSERLIAAYQPYSRQVEELRALRSQLLLRWFENGHKTLAILSAHPGEGCSYLAANLAIVFSQLGEHTLLVDANLRAPEQHTLFNLGQGLGLSDRLAGRADDEVVTRIPSFVDLSVLRAGTPPPNPQELLARDTFSSLIAKVGNSYDVVLFDAPPAALDSDALTIAARAEGVLLVVRKDHTRINDLLALSGQLQALGVEIVGCVINEF